MGRQSIRMRVTWMLAGGAALLAMATGTASAQRAGEVARPLTAPDVLEAMPQEARDPAKPKGYNLLSMGALTEAIVKGRELHYVLPIQYTDGTIYNPATGENDKVRLRSYDDKFLAPTILMEPGQTVRISLLNKLPVEPDCGKDKPINEPHCFNDTNLHSHGLWVSPTGNSDNVLLNIKPGVNFQYEYNVPEDHPAGTFWYHPHKHGSTAMQVGSGMAGALVIKGSRAPTMISNGDLDTLLQPVTANAEFKDQVMLIQQLPYACFDQAGNIEKDPVTKRWICGKNQIGQVKDFDAQFDFQAWGESGRYTMFNGIVRPTMEAKTGQLYRWRLIHAGVEETINLRIRKVAARVKMPFLIRSAKEQAAEVKALCTGTDVTQYEVAVDGLTRSSVYAKNVNNLQPGYRSDILFALPEPGAYCVYDDVSGKTAGDQIVTNDNAKIIGLIFADGDKMKVSTDSFVKEQMLKGADLLPEPVRKVVKDDINSTDGIKLDKYIPHRSVTDQEIKDSKQPTIQTVFNLDLTQSPAKYLINGEEYNPDQVDEKLVLGSAQEWKLSSLSVAHPYHIHVNPFEVVSIREKLADGSEGQEVTTGIYAGMKGTWRDTIMVSATDPAVIITIRTRYNRYIGKFVLHCHILDHEDKGMMQNVEIYLPGTDGKAHEGGHH